MRDFALPFDWVQSNIHCIQRCFEENFEKFHTNLRLDAKRTRVIDEYGFEFPHDYPLDESVSTDVIGTGVFGEEEGKTIVPTWENLCGLVREKYDRRIQRFKTIVQDTTTPIIVLCRYGTEDVKTLQQLFLKYYGGRRDMFFINSTSEVPFESEYIVNIHTEKNEIWNEPAIWKSAVDRVVTHIKTVSPQRYTA